MKELQPHKAVRLMTWQFQDFHGVLGIHVISM
jgi:hypothetical protein